ncbi:rab GTPase-binding effector protein 2-like [Pollicipes pollicipes]|uniref:rab GTPase-binding effector protein 2-like n=1 Tax=Pollicipes pollicipes TaxID=41117 RepID=UPI0018850ED0|nr:rab GTPase-binding effector protein 2-like [Pollicipes pollicipes]
MEVAQCGGDDMMAELERQRKAMEEDFGKRRAKFKEMFLLKEEELKQQQERVSQLQRELDDSRTQLAVAEVTFENQLDVERRKHAEEIASIQHLEKEQASSSLEDHTLRHQAEIRQLRAQLRQLQQQQQQLLQQPAEEAAGFGPHVLTAVTKQLAKKITLGGAVTSAAGTQASPLGSQENLDQSMRRAQEDTEMMRSLVIPLEEEIQALKQKLRDTDAQLQVQLTAREQLIRADQLLAQLCAGGRLEELAGQLRQQLPAEEQLPAGLAPHMYLYISVLEAQKLAISDDVKYGKQTQVELRAQLEPCRLIRTSPSHYGPRRLTLGSVPLILYLASSCILATSHLSGAGCMRQSRVGREPRGKVDLDRVPSTHVQVKAWWLAPRRMQVCLTVSHFPSSHNSELIISGRRGSNSNNKTKVSLRMPPSHPGSRRSQSEAEPEPAGCHGSMLSLDMAESSSTGSQRTDAGAGGRCERCASLESQLQQLQAELKAAEKRRAELGRVLERHQDDLGREARYRKQTEQEWQRHAEDYQQQISELYKAVETGEKRYHNLERRHKQFVSEVQDKLRRLTADRHVVQQELNRLQAENDTLLGKYSACSGELQNEFINLPDQVEELHLMLLRYKEELISAKIAREHVEETLRNQLAFMKNEQEALQHEKDSLNDELVAELSKLREEVTLKDSVSSELEAEQARRQQADGQLAAARDQLAQQTAMNRQMVAALQAQLEEQSSAKSSLQEEVSRLKTKVATLQLDLDNSEAVQRDFVKLSQSLQMELERIRQSDTEVRWQHEDDVDDCSRCHVRFTVSRRKHHCRHCGKIYCADCLNKAVPSGPSGTMSRVCEVCHTLLNRESAPYFSTEAPGVAD